MRLESQAETLIGCWKEGSGSHWGSVSPGMVASGPPFERTQGNAAEPGEQCQRNYHLSPSFPKQINKLPLVLKRVDHKLLATHLITIQSLFLSHSSFFLFLNFFHLLDYNCLTTVLQVLEKTLGKTDGKRRRGRQRMRWLDSITDSTDMNLSKLWEIEKDREACWATVHGVTKSWM